ncbi:MAG TPA: DUF5668 domain-containing protein [Thermoanaerobaculia bacterium]
MERHHLDTAKLCAGVLMLLIGTTAFLDAIDVLDVPSPRHWWPLILVVVGAVSEAGALRQRQSSGGFALMGTGLWLFVGAHEIFGFTYRSAFPLLIICVGLGMIVHAIIDLPKENAHDRQ